MIQDGQTVPVPDTFGNYALKGMAEITMPAEPGLFPLAPGWYVVIGIAAVVLAVRLVRRWLHWRRNKYRRDAVEVINSLSPESAGRIATEIKRVALTSFERTDVAGLSGGEWLEFLSGSYDGPPMQDETGRLLQVAAYQSPDKLEEAEFRALRDRSILWIMTHRTAEAGA